MTFDTRPNDKSHGRTFDASACHLVEYAPMKRILIAFNSNLPSLRRMISGALRYAAEKTMEWEMFTLNTDSRQFSRQLQVLAPFDGIISEDPAPILKLLHKQTKKPICVIAPSSCGESSPQTCSIDNNAVGRTAARILLKRDLLGYGYVGALRGSVRDQWHSKRRQNSFCKAIESAGMTVNYCSTPERITDLLNTIPKPAGIFTYNDSIAAEVLTCCHKLGLKVPAQISIIGVDDDPDICENATPTLSSVRPDFTAGGYAAARLLDTCLQHRRPHAATFGVHCVVERETTLAHRTGSKEIASAIRYIGKHYSDNLDAGTIARKLGISKNLLFLRFKEITGHTVRSEIEAVRLARAQEMLKLTKMTIKEIAQSCGYASAEHFHRVYRSRFGKTPCQTRLSPEQFRLPISRKT